MAQKHDIGHQKRRKNADALKRQELRREAARGYGRNMTPFPTGSNLHTDKTEG